MTKTKQQKFTDSLRQTQTNTFSEGLNMDLHPMSTPNTVLTDCINGTTITYNDNEFVLQNERGNTQILDAQLSAGFIPVAMKEYNGILYIISYNPTEQKTEIGTFPSPRQDKDVENKQFDSEIVSDYISYYSKYNKDVTYYDYSLLVSNYDKYYLSVSGQNYNPLLVLEHYVLDKQGNSSKVKLVQTGESYRFTHVGEGILGYVYRPYFLSSINSSLIPTKGANSAKLVINTTTDDDALWEPVVEENFGTSNVTNKKKIDDFKITHSVKIIMLSEKNDKLVIDLENSNIRHDSKLEVDAVDWDYTYNLTNTSVIDLQFVPEFYIIEEEETKTYKYDFRNECVVLMDGDNPTDTRYNNIEFEISTSIAKDDYVLYMDNLNHSVIVNAADVFAQESWFSKFQYFKSTDQTSANPDEVLIDFNIQLDLESYDINYQSYTDSNKGEATFKLHEIDETGNLKGVTVSGTSVSSASRIYDVVTDVSLMKAGDLWIDMNGTEGVLNYNKPNVGITPMQNPNNIQQCSEFKSSNTVAHVQYVKEDATTYNMILLDSNYNVVTTTNLFNTLRGEICGNDMEEYFTPGYIDFTAKDVKVKKNSFYLFELTFNILNVTENAWKTERASFIVITSDSMLNKDWVSGENRMDEILLESWFGEPYNIGKNEMDNLVDGTPDVVTKNNTLNLKEIKDKTYEELVIYTHKFFLKYDPLFSQANNYVIPQIYKNLDVTFNFKNLSAFNCFVKLDDHELFSSAAHDEQNLEKTYKKTWTLSGKASEIRQTVKRKYLWDLFKEINKVDKIKINKHWSTGLVNHVPDVMGYAFENPSESYATWINYLPTSNGIYTHLLFQDWLNSDNEIDSTYSFQYLWNYLIPNTSTLYGASLQIMKRMFTDNGLHYGEIGWRTNGNYPKYSGNNKKIWMHAKHGGIYVLLGLDLQEDYETTNNYYKELLKHAYYLVPTNKKLYQYIYDLETVYDEYNVPIGDQIVIKSINPKINNNLTGKMYPKQCLFIDLDYSSFNIQSFNNINYHVLDNINVTNHNSEVIPSFGELDENYSTFLRLLGTLLNTYPISENTLNEYFDKNLRFDYYAEHLQENDCFLFTDKIELLNKGQFYNTFNKISTPNLQYDQDLQILYNPSVFENNINTFGSGAHVLKWNYFMKFNDFWPINDNELKNLNDYHSLLFYRYSSYANE